MCSNSATTYQSNILLRHLATRHIIANREFLPSAPSTLWFLLAWKPLLFKALDKIVFVTKFSNRSQSLLALNLWCLTSYLPGFCKRSVCWHLYRLFNYIIIFIFVCMRLLHKSQYIVNNASFAGDCGKYCPQFQF